MNETNETKKPEVATATEAQTAQPAETPDAPPVAEAQTAQPAETPAAPTVDKKVTGRLFMGFKKPAYITGVHNGRTYEFIATQVVVGDQVHDLTLDLDKWDEVAAAAAPSTTVVFSGRLVRAKNPYVVNAKDPTKSYERMEMRNPELADIIDSKGSAIAFARGARLPSSQALKERYLARVDATAVKVAAVEGNIV